MITLSVRLRRRRTLFKSAREFNEAVRASLFVAATYWITHFLALHFKKSAVQRYDYVARGVAWNRVKRYRAAKRGEQALPLVFKGKARRELLGRPLGEFNIQPRATAKKQTVRIPLRVSHPFHTKNAGEIGRLVNEEREAMTKAAMEHFEKECARVKEITSKTIG